MWQLNSSVLETKARRWLLDRNVCRQSVFLPRGRGKEHAYLNYQVIHVVRSKSRPMKIYINLFSSKCAVVPGGGPPSDKNYGGPPRKFWKEPLQGTRSRHFYLFIFGAKRRMMRVGVPTPSPVLHCCSLPNFHAARIPLATMYAFYASYVASHVFNKTNKSKLFLILVELLSRNLPQMIIIKSTKTNLTFFRR